MREVANFQVERYAVVARWPLGELLLAFEQRLREQARHDYEVEVLMWAVLAQSGATKRKMPEPPALLLD